eukprot:COSAG06_NODE_890_length_11734_cov_37.735367_12_plen_711_part_00
MCQAARRVRVRRRRTRSAVDGDFLAAGFLIAAMPRVPDVGGALEVIEPLDGSRWTADPISWRHRALLTLALAVALSSPVALPVGLFYQFGWSTAGEVCPFVPVDPDAQAEIDKLMSMSNDQRVTALSLVADNCTCNPLDESPLNMSMSMALQLLRDADNGLFSETWIASTPIALRNAFLAWVATTLFVTAADLQQDRGLMGMAVGGYSARGSDVGDGIASAAGWLASVGKTNGADLSYLMMLWGKALVWGMISGAFAFGIIQIPLIEWLLLCISGRRVTPLVCSVVGVLLGALSTFYYNLQYFSTSTNQRQPTWEDARKALGLNWRQAIGLSTAKLMLWHWSQPFAYMLVFERYFGCSDFMDGSQQVVGSIVAAREVMYVITTVVAVFACPVYLLLDVRTVVQEAETHFHSFYRVLAYLAMPHNFVSLCLANRSAQLRLIFLPLALCQVIADFASCFALGPLLLTTTPSPAALKIGYFITSVAFVGFFGPLTVLSLLQKARDKQGRIARAFAAVGGVLLGLGLLYVVVGFIIAAIGFDVLCGWFWFMTPDCGEHSVCGAATYGECGPCSDGYVTGVGYNGYNDEGDPSRRHWVDDPPCELAPAYVLSSATDSAYDGRYERLADNKCYGAPVYQLGGKGGSVMYRKSNGRWLVGNSKRIVDCSEGDSDWVIDSPSHSCHVSPDGASCAGKWKEKDGGGTWRDAPSLKVTAG